MKRFIIFVLALLMCISAEAQFGKSVAFKAAAVKKPAAGGGGGGPEFIVSGHGSDTRDDFSGQVGFKFTPSANITVTDLGLLKQSGNSHTHLVRIYNDLNIELVSTTIDLSSGGVGYIYNSVTPTVLTSGSVYYIVATYTSGGGDSWYGVTATGVTSTSDGVVNFGTYVNGTPPPFNNGASGAFSFANPNFKYTKP